MADQRIILEFIGDPTGLKPAFDAMKAMGQLTKEQEAAFNAANAAFASRHGAAVQAEKDQKKLTEEVSKTDTEMDDLVTSTKQLPKAIKDGATATSGLNAGFSKVGNTVSSVGKQIASAFGIAGVIYTVIQQITKAFTLNQEFGLQMATVTAVLQGTDAEMKMLTQDAIDLGAATKYSATEVGKLQEEFAKLGFTAPEIHNVTEATLLLAEATGIELGRAAEVAGTTLKGFGLASTETARVVDVMAGAMNRTALDVDDFSEAMKYVAVPARAAGISLETTTALLGKLADVGIKGSMGGTALKNLLGKLADGSSDLAKAAGGAVKNSDDLFRAFENLAKTNIDFSAALELTDERAAAAFLTFVKGVPALKELNTQMHNVTGETQAMADVMRDTLAGDVDRLTGAWDELLRSVGESAPWRGAIQFLTDLVGWIDQSTKGLGLFWDMLTGKFNDDIMDSSLVKFKKEFGERWAKDIADGVYTVNSAVNAMIRTQKELTESEVRLMEISQLRKERSGVATVAELSAWKKEETALKQNIQLNQGRIEVLKNIWEAEEARLQREADAAAEKAKNDEADLKAAAEKLAAQQAAERATRGAVGSIKYLTWELGELKKGLESAKAGDMVFIAYKEKVRLKALELDAALKLLKDTVYTFSTSENVIDVTLNGQSTTDPKYAKEQMDLMFRQEELRIKTDTDTFKSTEERNVALQRLQITHLKAMIAHQKTYKEDSTANEIALADAKAKAVADGYDKMFQSATDYEDKTKGKWDMSLEEVTQTMSSLFDSITEIQNNAANAEMTELDRQLERGLISQEEYEKKRNAILNEQAVNAHAAAMFKAMINVALAVTSALSNYDYASAIAFGVLGAAEIATIATTPIPQYAKGTKKAPHGFKWVGEEGAELIYDGGGYPIITNRESELLANDPMSLDAQKVLAKYDIPQLTGTNWGSMKVSNLHSSKLVEKTGVIDYDRMADIFMEKFMFNDSNIVHAIDRQRSTEARLLKGIESKLGNNQKRRGRA